MNTGKSAEITEGVCVCVCGVADVLCVCVWCGVCVVCVCGVCVWCVLDITEGTIFQK